jgi:hypothetical protein
MSAALTIPIPVWLDFVLTLPLLAYRLLRYGYPFRRIYLGEGEWTILDPADYYRFGHFKWHVSGNNGKFYAVRTYKVDANTTSIRRLHRDIMNAQPGELIDHRNGNSFDNRQDNLRPATSTQNGYNKRKRKNASSQYIGVSYDKNYKKWVAQISYDGKLHWLGRFENEIDAAKAYDSASKKYHKEFAKLNFLGV